MAKRILGRCPVCNEGLAVTELKCSGCDTDIRGRFQPCPYCRLSEEQEHLVSVFLKTRGNIREVEKELGISYPTVRARLDEVVKALGMTPLQKGGKGNTEEEAG
ncbi:MAG: DUF2089 family protein [Planctomycetota bacterium]|jgi:hypothetical protein